MIHDQANYERDGEGVREPLLSEKGRETVDVREDSPLPDDLTREELTLPNPSEPETARHYTRLSQMNWAIDAGPYPLGSCTMKYNPKFTEDVAALADAAVHPDRPERRQQGTLELLEGPERIETGWWDGDDVERDYFVARNPAGSLLWIYRERRVPAMWYLHGLFS